MSKTTNKFSAEVRERAVRMVEEHQSEISVGMGGADVDRREDRLYDGGPAPVVIGSG